MDIYVHRPLTAGLFPGRDPGAQAPAHCARSPSQAPPARAPQQKRGAPAAPPRIPYRRNDLKKYFTLPSFRRAAFQKPR